MHTIEMLEKATEIATTLGYGVRQEWLGGCGGGACEIAGKKWIFLDLALGTCDQLEQLVAALREDPSVYGVDLPIEMSGLIDHRRAA